MISLKQMVNDMYSKSLEASKALQLAEDFESTTIELVSRGETSTSKGGWVPQIKTSLVFGDTPGWTKPSEQAQHFVQQLNGAIRATLNENANHCRSIAAKMLPSSSPVNPVCETEPRHPADTIWNEARARGAEISIKEMESEAMGEAYEFEDGSTRGNIARYVLFLVEKIQLMEQRQ